VNLRLLLALNIVDADEQRNVIDAVADELSFGRIEARTSGDLITGLRYASVRRLWPIALPTTTA
jgi:hypothetical protein